jgi:hypothetical protein
VGTLKNQNVSNVKNCRFCTLFFGSYAFRSRMQNCLQLTSETIKRRRHEPWLPAGMASHWTGHLESAPRAGLIGSFLRNKGEERELVPGSMCSPEEPWRGLPFSTPGKGSARLIYFRLARELPRCPLRARIGRRSAFDGPGGKASSLHRAFRACRIRLGPARSRRRSKLAASLRTSIRCIR